MDALKSSKINAVSLHKEYLKTQLKEIILDQYYYEEGVYQNKLKFDKTIQEAVKILKNKSKYNQILSAN